ncbi:MAG: hypothetical protein CMP66_05335 [Flavobacteriales bacterium]|nr:hypothetical protein [Flavobacteriales bacterium]
MKHLYTGIIIFLSLLNLNAQTLPDLDFEIFKTGFNSPVSIANAGDDRLFIVEQGGIIKVIDNGNTSTFLNISSIVNDGQSEQGLLGLAFHPNYATNGYFYIHYNNNTSTGSTGKQTSISRFRVEEFNPNIADPSSELVLLTIDQPYWNHNGGCIDFGPDGYLYIGMGDGGSSGDPQNYSQNTQSMLGKMLRIDVDNGNPYSIPSDNPFVGSINTLEEIWAIGLRNPWRFSFDKQTGDMWIGDVGQNAWEEINFQDANSSGGENYGWRCYEGFAPFNSSGCNNSYVDPVQVYENNGWPNDCSVTGGYVYRGTQFPNFVGHYVFTDYCTGKFFTIYDNLGGAGWTTTTQEDTQYGVSTFGEGNDGELYFADINTGIIYHIIDNSPVASNILEISKTEFYPNPTKAGNMVQINNNINFSEITITSLNGQVLYKCITTENAFQIPANLSDGIYFIQVNGLNPNTLVIQND